MNRIIFKCFVGSICVFLLVGCDFSKNDETISNHQIIELALSDLLTTSNSLTIGELILFDVTNTSDKYVWFPPDFNVELFAKPDGQWVSIENEFDHGPFEHLLEPFSALFYSSTLYVFPNLPDRNSPIEMHMTVTGFIVENGITTNESVSAELDFVLSP